MRRTTTVALLVGGMIAFGTATPVSAIVGRGFPVWLASAMRMLLAAAVLVPLTLQRRRADASEPVVATIRGASRTDKLALLGIALVGTFGFSALMLAGMREAPGAVAAIVMATTPAVTAVGAVAFLGDRLGRWRIVAVVLSVVGVVVATASASGGGGDRVVLGSALVFGAVCCEASYTLLGKRLGAELDALALTATAAVLALVAFLPLAIGDLVAFDWSRPTVGQWLAVGWWGVGTMALGSVLWFSGMQRTEAGTAAAFMGVMPVSALLGSYLLLGEPFRWVHLAGIAIVLLGLVAVIRSGAAVH